MTAPPSPPWRTQATALLWPQRLGLGGLVAYRDGPVGPYAELFAARVRLHGGRPAGHVTFMAVDSEASVAGGRENWALPKELAAFAAEAGGLTVRGDGWAVRLRATVRPRRLPALAAARCAQPWPDGRVRAFGVRFRGSARAAAVEVADSSVPWLPAGAHPAVALSGVIDVLPPS